MRQLARFNLFRARRLSILAISAVLGLTACNSSAQTEPAGGVEKPVSGGTLTYAEVTPIDNFQTQNARFYEKANVLNSVLDRLTYFDPKSKKLVPWIAQKFTHNKDFTEFVFTLRDGVTFSDGSPLDAAAVKANLDVFGHGNKAANIQPNVDFSHYGSTQVVNNKVVKVRLTAPDPNFLRATSAVTAGLVAPATLKADTAAQSSIEHIIGSGPFTYESAKADEEVVLKARKDYAWAPATAANQGAPYLDRVVVKYLPEVAHRAGAVQSGQVDLARGIQPVDEKALKASGQQVFAAPGLDLTANQAAVRVGSGKLADRKVRQALQFGTDRQAIKDAVLSDSYRPAASIFNHGAAGFVDFSHQLRYDKAKAEKLLREAGWLPGPDGIRVKDGQRLKVTLTSSNNSVVVRPAAELLEQQWRELGVELVNRAADNSFLAQALNNDQVEIFATRQFAYGGLGPVYLPANNTQLVHTHPELARIFAAETRATTPAARAKALRAQQQALVLDEAYTIVLWDEVQVYGGHHGTHIEFTSGTAPIFQGAWKNN